MTKVLEILKRNYYLDGFSLLLLLTISFAAKSTYKVVLGFVVLIIIVQFYRFFTQKVSKETFFYTCFYALIYSAIFYRSVQTVLLIVLLSFCAFIYHKEKPKLKLIAIKTEKLILIYFGLITINLLIFKPILKGLDKYLYLLFFPLLFILIKKIAFKIEAKKAMKVFICSVLTATFVLLLKGILTNDLIFGTHTFFAEYIDLTHVYYGMFVSVAAIFIVILHTSKSVFFNKTIDAVILLAFILLLVYTGARISLIGLAIIILIAFLNQLNWHWFKKLIVLFIFSLLLIVVASKVPRVQQGITEIQQVYKSVKENNKEDLIKNSSKNMYLRYLVLKYTVNEIQDNWLLGIGMQNVKEKISQKIIDDGYKHVWHVNTHNQYLEIWVGMGIFVFLYFIWMLFSFYKLQSYSIYFITFFLIIMLTESLLVRVKGISLFFLFSLIFSIKESTTK